MGIPKIGDVLEYLSPFMCFQKLLVADKKRYNIHLIERLEGDGEVIVGGPIYLLSESYWSEARYVDALFEPPSDRFLELMPPFLKYHRQVRDGVGHAAVRPGHLLQIQRRRQPPHTQDHDAVAGAGVLLQGKRCADPRRASLGAGHQIQ